MGASAAIMPGARATAQCTYTVQIIEAPTCPGDNPSPTRGEGLNESGHVVGYYSPCTTGNHKAYVWTGGPGIITLQPPPGVSEWQAFDIANTAENGPLGRIVGQLDGTNYPIRGFVYDNGQWTIIQPPRGGLYTSASATNDNVATVGYQSNGKTGSLEAVMWINGAAIASQLPHGPNSVAMDTNDRNHVIGWMGNSINVNARGFLWQDGNVIDLGLLPGSTGTAPAGINSHPQIVGRALLPDPDGSGIVAHAFLWEDGELIDLGLGRGMLQAAAGDINDDSIVVGVWRGTSVTDRPMIWRDGVMMDLATLVQPNSGVTIRSASAISNAGQIICTGIRHSNFNTVAILLTPVSKQPGDSDCDGMVGVNDLFNVIRAWGPCLPYPAHCPTDFNGDDVVNVPDLLAVLMNWGAKA